MEGQALGVGGSAVGARRIVFKDIVVDQLMLSALQSMCLGSGAEAEEGPARKSAATQPRLCLLICFN